MAEPTDVIVYLMPEFSCVIDDREIQLPATARRLVTYLALEPMSLTRTAVRERLWPDADRDKTAHRLRQVLWVIRRATGSALIAARADKLRLVDSVTVDYQPAAGLARQILRDPLSELGQIEPILLRLLETSLLREMDDETVQAERSRWDHVRRRALEKVARAALAIGDGGWCLELAAQAADIDELAEEPHRLIAEAHLLRGDIVSAYRTVWTYSACVRDGLGVDPSPAMNALMDELLEEWNGRMWNRRRSQLPDE